MLSAPTNLTALEAKLFRGFSDPSRLSVLKSLRGGEKCVSDIVSATSLSQPNVSAHLSCLRDCGLVVSRQEGRMVYYGLADERLEEVFMLAEDILVRIIDRVQNCARYPQ